MEKVGTRPTAAPDALSIEGPRPDATERDRSGTVSSARNCSTLRSIKSVTPAEDVSTYVLRFYGDPILKEKASRVEPGTLDRNLVDQLVRQCARAWPDPGLGMAAQQLGSLQKVAIARFTAQTDEERTMAGKDGRTVFVLVNPRITARSEETKNCVGEGCLSVPLFRTSVRRHVWVDLEWEDEKFQPHKRRLHHLDAQLAQHECDHLNGICIADRVGRQQRREAERLVEKARARG